MFKNKIDLSSVGNNVYRPDLNGIPHARIMNMYKNLFKKEINDLILKRNKNDLHQHVQLEAKVKMKDLFV